MTYPHFTFSLERSPVNLMQGLSSPKKWIARCNQFRYIAIEGDTSEHAIERATKVAKDHLDHLVRVGVPLFLQFPNLHFTDRNEYKFPFRSPSRR